jgi:hypothetical protein
VQAAVLPISMEIGPASPLKHAHTVLTPDTKTSWFARNHHCPLLGQWSFLSPPATAEAILDDPWEWLPMMCTCHAREWSLWELSFASEIESRPLVHPRS